MSTRILMRPKLFVVARLHPKYGAPPDMANNHHSGVHSGNSNTTTGSRAMVSSRKRPIGLDHVEAQRAKLPRNCNSMYKRKSCEEESKVTVEKDKGAIGIKDEDKTDPQCVVLSCNNATYNSSSSTESVRRKLIFESDPKPAKKEFNRKQMLEKRKASRAKLYDLSRMNYDTSLLDKQSEMDQGKQKIDEINAMGKCKNDVGDSDGAVLVHNKEVILVESVRGLRKRKGTDISDIKAKAARLNDTGEILKESARRSGARRVKKAITIQATPVRRSSRLLEKKLELAADNPKDRNNKRRSNDDDNMSLVLVNQENTEVNKEVKRLSKKRRSGLTVDVPIKKAKVIVQDNCMDEIRIDCNSISNSNDVKPALRRRSARIMEKLATTVKKPIKETPRYSEVQNKESSTATEENRSEETIKEFTSRCLRHFISLKKPSVNLNKLVKINNSPKWASQRSVTLHQLVLSGVVLE